MLLVVLCAAGLDAQINATPVLTGQQGVAEDPQPPFVPFDSAFPQPGPESFSISDDSASGRFGSSTTSFMDSSPTGQPLPRPAPRDSTGLQPDDASRFNQVPDNTRRLDVGIDLYSPPEFEGGLIVFGRDVAMKIGGFVKADFIYDFDPIDSTDSFVTTEIPVGATPRTNARFHTRQTRLSFDTRWVADESTVRVYVEGDFLTRTASAFDCGTPTARWARYWSEGPGRHSPT